MSFGVGKSAGMNNTHRKRMEKMVRQGLTPEEISDKLDVVVSCIESFYPGMGGKVADAPAEVAPFIQHEVASAPEAEAEAPPPAKKKAAKAK